jgi:hypothetical protein
MVCTETAPGVYGYTRMHLISKCASVVLHIQAWAAITVTNQPSLLSVSFVLGILSIGICRLSATCAYTVRARYRGKKLPDLSVRPGMHQILTRLYILTIYIWSYRIVKIAIPN